MDIAIQNLNEVIDMREKMITDIVYWEHCPNNDGEWERLEEKYRHKSFLSLKSLHNKYNDQNKGVIKCRILT